MFQFVILPIFAFEQVEPVVTIGVAQKMPLEPLDDIRIAADGQVKPVLILPEAAPKQA